MLNAKFLIHHRSFINPGGKTSPSTLFQVGMKARARTLLLTN